MSFLRTLGLANIKTTVSEIPTSGLTPGDIIYTTDTQEIYIAISASAVQKIAPTNSPTLTDPAIVIKAKNITGSTMTKGQTVYIGGADTGLPTLTLAKADVPSTSFIHGIVTESIAPGATGLVQKSGSLKNINTSSFAAGDILWLSSSTAGLLTNTQPSNPNVRMRMGVVITSHATTGEILLDTQALAVNSTEQIADFTNKRFVTDAQQTVVAATSGTNTGDQTNISGNAGTVTTNANLTGPITSVGNATTIAAKSGTTNTVVVSDSPLLETFVVLGSDVTTTSTSYVDVTGLSFSAAANTKYRFFFDSVFQSSLAGQGIGFSVNGPASPTFVVGLSNTPITLNTSVSRSFRAYDSGTPSTGVDTLSTNNFGTTNGIFSNGSTAGTFQVRFRADTTNTVTIKAGSILRYRIIT